VATGQVSPLPLLTAIATSDGQGQEKMAHSVLLKFTAVVLIAAMSAPLLASQAAWAAGPDDEVDEMPDVEASPGQLAAGQVVATNRAVGTITIRHQGIPELFMQTMTMVFRVSDKAMLEGLTPGDKIRFKVERDGRSYVVTRIEHSN
jgi:Cu/Ag efflux protein CusF